MNDTMKEHLQDVSQDLSTAIGALREAEADVAELTSEIAELKPVIKNRQKRVNDLSADIRAIHRGNYNPPLAGFDKPDDEKSPTNPTRVDPGVTDLLETLLKHGATDHLVRSIIESELAKSFSIRTVADLERAMREDELWHRKIKGVGKDKIDKVIDALISYRKENPVPSDDDDEFEDVESIQLALPEPTHAVVTVGRSQNGERWYFSHLYNFGGEQTQGNSLTMDSPFADTKEGAVRGSIDQLVFAAKGSDLLDGAVQQEVIAKLMEAREEWCMEAREEWCNGDDGSQEC